MKFSTENPGTWFYFNDDNEDDGGICMRVLSLAETTTLDKRFKKVKVEYKRGNRFEVEKVDDVGYDKAMWDVVILDWKEVCDGEGKPLECTKENKYMLMQGSVAFATFITEKTEVLSKMSILDSEDAAKNSLKSQNGID